MNWPYTKRSDGRISVTLDNNVWNFLFENGIDLASEFPAEQFALFIPREVEIEAGAIKNNTRLLEYIQKSIVSAQVATTSSFGFNAGETPQRTGSFNSGTFQSVIEREVYAELHHFLSTTPKGSGLYKDEADAAVAVASLGSIVLTMELPEKAGPLRYVRERGGRIVHLDRTPDSARSLRQQVLSCYEWI